MAQLQTTGVTGSLTTTGNLTTSGDLAVNGGDITSTASTLFVSSSNDIRLQKGVYVNADGLLISGALGFNGGLFIDRENRAAGAQGPGALGFYSGSATPEALIGVTDTTPSFQILGLKPLLFRAGAGSSTRPALSQNEKAPSYNIGIGTVYQTGFDVYISGSNIALDGDVIVPSGRSIQLTSSNISFTSGNGIDFTADSNATGMTSELLDDYEEGSFTPTLAGPTSITYDVAGQQANYVKVGDLVLVTIRIEPATIAGAGALTITGLPFVSSGTSFGTTWIANCRANSLATGLITVIGEIAGGSTTISLFKRTASSTTDTALLASDLNATSAIRVTLTYRSA